MPIAPPIRCPEACRIRRRCVVEGCQCGRIAARGGRFAGMSSKSGACAPGWRYDTSSPLGELVSSLRKLIGYHRKQSSCGRAGTKGFPPGALRHSARKRIDPSRVARESGIRAADTNARGIRWLSGAHPVSVRCCRMRSAVRFASGRNRAIPKREEGTGADHGPSSPVPPRARNALRLRFAPRR